MEWIETSVRIPDNRREVLTWGTMESHFHKPRTAFLGVSRCNITKEGHKFDNEGADSFWNPYLKVTHWAEIRGPNDNRE